MRSDVVRTRIHERVSILRYIIFNVKNNNPSELGFPWATVFHRILLAEGIQTPNYSLYILYIELDGVSNL